MNHKVYIKQNVLYIELLGVDSGFALDVLNQVKDLLHLLKRPYHLIFDYHTLDEQQLLIPTTEIDSFIQIIELLDRTGRAHAVWIHLNDSKNADVLGYLINRHSIAYTKALRSQSILEAEKLVKKLIKK